MDQQEKDGWKRVVREVLQVRVCIHPYFQKDDLSVRELSTVIMDCVTQDNVTNIVFCLYVLLRDDLLCLPSVYPRGCRHSVATPLPSRFVNDCGQIPRHESLSVRFGGHCLRRSRFWSFL